MVTRYDMEYGVNKFHSREPQVVPVQSTQGEWVSFEDYAALASQVEALRKAIDESGAYKTNQMLSDALHQTPQQHLAEIKAQAGRDGFVAGSEQTAQFITGEIGYVLPLLETRASQYAEQIRKGTT